MTTETPAEVLVIDGRAFLDAISAPELLADGLRRTIASRLRRAGQVPASDAS